jgi:two-component system, OmpR family, KDP operon response regulator KdpE
MDKPVKILVIEDSAEIQEAASLIFELHWADAVVIQSLNGGDGLEKARLESPDIVLLDLGLPDMDGLRVLKELRSYSNVPVIILTVRGEEMDKVRGLEMGADDYVVKPFAHRELLARMKAVLSRQASPAAAIKSQDDKARQTTNIVKIDLNTGTVTRNDRPVKLTSTEYNLIKYMAGQNGKTKSETDILANIWGEEYTDCSEYLQVYVKRLREKLEENPLSPKVILKDPDGYRIAAGVI